MQASFQFFFLIIIAVTSESGRDFQDDFDQLTDEWEIFDDDIICNGPTCSYLSKNNVAANPHGSGHNNVELLVRNDCRGSQCCLNNTVTKGFCCPKFS